MNEFYNAFSSTIRKVQSICSICGKEDHFTFEHFPEHSANTQHVPDKPYKNPSRYSVPDGLMIIDTVSNGSFVVTTQKFARGTRFGPLLAPKSFSKVDVKFPLIIFSNEYEYNFDGSWKSVENLDLPKEIQELFTVRNFYLDTSKEKHCNWLIHVSVAKYLEEQNLMCYQENDQIYFTSIKDIGIGDILKVWYAPNYGKKMGMDILPMAEGNPNIQVSFNQMSMQDLNENRILNTFIGNESESDSLLMKESAYSNSSFASPTCTQVNLPPVNSLMKNQSPVYDQSNSYGSNNTIIDFFYNPVDKDDLKLFDNDYTKDCSSLPDNDCIASTSSSSTILSTMSPTATAISSDITKTSDCLNEIETLKPMPKTTDAADNESEIHKYTCEFCNRKYITKTNLEKHLRSHNLYMCIFCMKMFSTPHELKEHDCFKFKATTKKPLLHCTICLKVLSNAWSLQRHMKLHKNVMDGQKSEDEPMDIKPNIEEILPVVPLIEPPIQTIQISELSMPSESSIDNLSLNGDVEPIQIKTENLAAWEKPQIYDKCIVCARTFKNPNSLEKHLRNVHTAHVVRPELTPSIKKSSEYKKIVLNNTKPIKDDVAKLLASKLKKNKSNNKCEETTSSSWSEVESQQQDQTMFMSDNEFHLDNLTPLILPVDSGNTINLSDSDLIIISNVANDVENANHLYNNAISITKDNEIVFNNIHKGEAMLPKLVPISSPHTTEPIKNNKRSDPITASTSKNGEESSPKVFIIDKNNESNFQVQNDVSNVEPVKESFKCNFCDKVFPKFPALKRHLDVHENLFYFCPFCKKSPVKARSSLRKHFFKDHLDKSDIWQTSNFMSKLLRKYDKSSSSASQLKLPLAAESHERVKRKYNKKTTKTAKVKKNETQHCDLNVPNILDKSVNEIYPAMINNSNDSDTKNLLKNELEINDELLDLDKNSENQSDQNIILHNLFLDPISYSLNSDNDFIIHGQHHDSVENDLVDPNGRIDHTNSIENYEISDFRDFKNSFDEIQSKLDAELEFNTEQMIKWNDVDLNDDDSSAHSSVSNSSKIIQQNENSIISNGGTNFIMN